MPCDPNAQAGAWARGMQRKLGEMGFNCRLVRPSKSKATRFAPFTTISQAGFVNIVKGDWYNEFCSELENFEEENQRKKNDIVDAVSDGIFILNQQQQLPQFSLPSLGLPAQTSFVDNLPFTTNLPMESLGLPS